MKLRHIGLSFGIVMAAIPATALAQDQTTQPGQPAQSDQTAQPEQQAQPVQPIQPESQGSQLQGQPDEVLRGDTVINRARPDYDPLGVPVGGFMLYPNMYASETYNSNIYGTPSGDKGDFISSIEPSLDLKSNWGANALNFHAGSNTLRYIDHPSEDYTDYGFSTDGRLDVYHDARIYGSAGYQVEHVPRYSPNSITGQTAPTEYSDTSASVGVEKEFNRLAFRLDDNFDRYAFQNAFTGTGALLAEGRDDYNQNQLTLHTTYEFAPQRQVYLLTAYDWRMYDTTSDILGYDRNSTGYTLALGARYDLTGILFADVYLGYFEEDYADARLGSLAGPTGQAKLTWNVTRLTTITGSVTRNIEETILQGSAGYFATVETANVDHELLRNLILSGSVSHESDDFAGYIDRTDDYYTVTAGAKYLINNNFWINGGYSYQTRSSDQPGLGFGDNVVFVGVSAHL